MNNFCSKKYVFTAPSLKKKSLNKFKKNGCYRYVSNFSIDSVFVSNLKNNVVILSSMITIFVLGKYWTFPMSAVL